MPSFLKRFSTLKGSNSGSTQPIKSEINKSSQYQQKQQTPPQNHHDNSNNSREDIGYGLNQELFKRGNVISNESSLSDSSSSSHPSSSKASNSTSTTISSSSSLSLFMTDGPSPNSTYKRSSRQGSEMSDSEMIHHTQQDNINQHQHQQQIHMRNAHSSTSSSSSSSLRSSQAQKTKRNSMPSLSALFHPRPRPMTMIQDNPVSLILEECHPESTSRSAPSSKRVSVDDLGSNPSRMSENFSLEAPDAQSNTPSSPTMKGKKIRPKSLSSLLLQHEQQTSNVQPRLSNQPKANRWANRSSIGSKEMMVDLETTGVFVPSNGQRLRVEFVYRTVILCADEIRSRGLDHVNIFCNPSPKKVISSMIALMMDQDRCDLYSIRFLRIDTVTGLMLNLLSQMSNPVIPYPIMEHYFKMGATTVKSPILSASPAPASFRRSSNQTANSKRSPSPISSLLPTIPALPPKGSSQATMAWAREYFDLPAFLDVLPPMNRVILLEVLHLCQELLDHQIWNRVSFSRLVEQIAPALFSTVFDQKILETMAGLRRCSIHGDTISPEEGNRAEIHLFSVILVRFLYLTAYTSSNAAMNNMVGNDVRNSSGEEYASSQQEIYGHGSGSVFRKSQELLQQEHQDYHERMARSYHEIEIQQQPLQHFGVYSESQKQQQQQQLQQLK
ncbi:hypothetical protein BGX26_003257 [Mortierella sp. AD094]|nr:hypothetical protein BGX26_003257 [Mortierella sp. AD094]